MTSHSLLYKFMKEFNQISLGSLLYIYNLDLKTNYSQASF